MELLKRTGGALALLIVILLTGASSEAQSSFNPDVQETDAIVSVSGNFSQLSEQWTEVSSFGDVGLSGPVDYNRFPDREAEIRISSSKSQKALLRYEHNAQYDVMGTEEATPCQMEFHGVFKPSMLPTGTFVYIESQYIGSSVWAKKVVIFGKTKVRYKVRRTFPLVDRVKCGNYLKGKVRKTYSVDVELIEKLTERLKTRTITEREGIPYTAPPVAPEMHQDQHQTQDVKVYGGDVKVSITTQAATPVAAAPTYYVGQAAQVGGQSIGYGPQTVLGYFQNRRCYSTVYRPPGQPPRRPPPPGPPVKKGPRPPGLNPPPSPPGPPVAPPGPPSTPPNNVVRSPNDPASGNQFPGGPAPLPPGSPGNPQRAPSR